MDKIDRLADSLEGIEDSIDDLKDSVEAGLIWIGADVWRRYVAYVRQLRDNLTLPKRNGAGWDLFLPEDVTIHAGETVQIPLGFAMQLPTGFHAKIFVRSSTWKRWGVCLSNQTGIIDNAYSGDNDEWILSVYRPNSFREGYPERIPAGTRIAQFLLERDAPDLKFQILTHLPNTSRGGFGSTGE